MDNPEKPPTLGTQDTRRRQNKTQHNMCWTLQYTAENDVKRHEPSYKQLEVKTNLTFFVRK